MTFTIRDNLTYGAQLAAADAIAGYGNSQGAAHVWTPEEWAAARATGKPLHLIVFLGHGAADAIDQAHAVGASVVWYDVEGQFTATAIASDQPQAFGDDCKAAGFPAAVYGTDELCDAVEAHFAGVVRYRTAEPSVVAPGTAYQWDHQPDYDESVAADDFPGAPSPPPEEDMTPQQAQQLQDLWNNLTAMNTVADRVLSLTQDMAIVKAGVADIQQKVDAGGGVTPPVGTQVSGTFTGTIS